MNIYFASSAELYREHRRTQSLWKKKKIAAELQSRHDEINGGSCGWHFHWWDKMRREIRTVPVQRFRFDLWLP